LLIKINSTIELPWLIWGCGCWETKHLNVLTWWDLFIEIPQ